MKKILLSLALLASGAGIFAPSQDCFKLETFLTSDQFASPSGRASRIAKSFNKLLMVELVGTAARPLFACSNLGGFVSKRQFLLDKFLP